MDNMDVSLFGSFQITYHGICLDEQGIHSTKMTALLSYFLIYNNRKISTTELNDILWEDDSNISNPLSALKNLMYRLRSLLKKEFKAVDMIITGKGSYYWNPQIKVHLDTDSFEELDKLLKKEHLSTCKEVDKLNSILKLYKGKFLPCISDKRWVVSLSTYYHSLYIRCAKELAMKYEDLDEYEKMNTVCKDALVHDPLDDEMQYLFISSLIRLKHYDLAKEQYHRACSLLYERLGIRQSQFLQKVYMELIKNNNQVNANLDAIQDSIAEKKMEQAFYCEFGVFKEIYHLELRRMVREGFSEYVVLMTLQPKKFIDANSKEGLHLLSKEMEALRIVLCKCLRNGDVVSKYSGSQFIFMLHSCNAENAKRVIKRILNNYASLNKHNLIDLSYTYDELQLFDNDTLKG